jgi:hypothetical protein
MINDFKHWLAENEGRISKQEFARKFIAALQEEFRTYPAKDAEFEGWWSVSGKDWDEHDVAYLDSLERVERKKPGESRYGGDVYMLEFQIEFGNNTRVWRLSSLDTRDFSLTIDPDMKKSGIDLGERLQKVFDELLLKTHPGAYHGKQYGV